MDTFKKKYKEANDKVAARFGTNVAKEIFTDLYESEDEKIVDAIRKALESKIEDLGNGVTRTACLAWLEKQGEQKPTDKVEPKFKIGDKVIGIVSDMQYYITDVCYDHYYTESGCIIMFCSQDNFKLVEQKPAWSEEDEVYLNTTIAYLKDAQEFKKMAENCIGWLKNLKQRIKKEAV